MFLPWRECRNLIQFVLNVCAEGMEVPLIVYSTAGAMCFAAVTSLLVIQPQ